METARVLRPEHPEVQMFRRRCLGDAQGLYAKANELAEAGDDRKALKVRPPLYLGLGMDIVSKLAIYRNIELFTINSNYKLSWVSHCQA